MADQEAWRPPRACDDYWSEWKQCKSILNLFHHYYTYGETPSCAQWKRDYQNCRAWEKTKSTVAKDALCNSERERIAEKQKHAPVWTLRKSPPADWYLPLDEDKPK
ncbi:synaptic plasticity regulator PANTS [Anolis carolinensis]|uniref:Synaptic plasticity regulator PANTS n=1 Tax=Anolis carolinensis TaxID=28377 RepID=H9G4I7_ANOCA|nr:PREDICTED: UPF0545 protein C22orf39 homolog [Anolis carolinensis]|eukprot:XP_003225168.1 PREDICTED: UPF0545 protein C22orf39 homolog [Anolis carolinensis]